LKKTKTYGLTESVSQYVFVRCLDLAGEKYADYQFANLDPGEVAKNMQARSKGTEAIMVWNPFLLQALKLRPDVKVLFDSSKIPEEVIDMVVIGDDVLNQPGGREFACALIDCYYEFNRMFQDPAQRDELLVALGKRFFSLNIEEMKKATTQTRFYKAPQEGLALCGSDTFHKRMASIVDLYGQLKIIKGKSPTFGFGAADQASAVNLRFDPTFMPRKKCALAAAHHYPSCETPGSPCASCGSALPVAAVSIARVTPSAPSPQQTLQSGLWPSATFRCGSCRMTRRKALSRNRCRCSELVTAVRCLPDSSRYVRLPIGLYAASLGRLNLPQSLFTRATRGCGGGKWHTMSLPFSTRWRIGL
jgi:hypothetical protein